MNFDKFQICEKPAEILKIFDNIMSKTQTIVMWQNIGDQDRVVYDSILQKIDRKNKNIIIVPLDEGQTKYKLKKNITLYMHGEERSIVFKTTKFISTKSKIVVQIPNEIRIIENREHARFDLKKSAERSVLHLKEVGLEGSGTFKNFSINCYDLSQTGMGLELHTHHLLRYQIGDSIELKTIADIPIPNKVIGTVKYICPMLELPDVKYFRAGIQFDQVLDSETLKQILMTNRSAA